MSIILSQDKFRGKMAVRMGTRNSSTLIGTYEKIGDGWQAEIGEGIKLCAASKRELRSKIDAEFEAAFCE